MRLPRVRFPVATAMLVLALLARGPSPAGEDPVPTAGWARYATLGGGCDALFPAKPATGRGAAPVETLELARDGVRYAIGASAELDAATRRRVERGRGAAGALEAFREATLAAGPGSEVLLERPLRRGDAAGRESLVRARGGALWRMRLFYDGRRMYYALVVAEDREKSRSARSTAFLDSLRLGAEVQR